MTIEVYPSTLPGDPIERHQWAGTLADWLAAHCPGYEPADPAQPITATVDGELIHPSYWCALQCAAVVVELRPTPREPTTLLYVLAGIAAGAVLMTVLAPRPKAADTTRGAEAALVDAQANTPKLNGVVPEIAGRYRVYPDYLCQPRRSFIDSRTEAVDMMLCIGRGEFEINAGDVFLGETPSTTLGDEMTYTIYQPGATVSDAVQSQNWYTVPEVGANRSGAGLRLIDEAVATGSASTITGSIAPDGLYFAFPVTFFLDGASVTLNSNYTTETEGGPVFDPAAMLAAINGQIAGVRLVASFNGTGYLVITEQAPYSGEAITLTGTTASTFGTPTFTTGTISTGLWLGPFRLTPANETAQQIEFDVFAPNGLGNLNADGSVESVTRTVELQWRQNSGDWTTISKDLTGSSRDQAGWTFAEALPGAYSNIDVRMRRLGAESTSMSFLDRLEWYGMRCRLPAPASYPGATTMAVRIVGSDRIAGNSTNKINAIVTRKLGGVATRSIAAWVRHVCASVGYADTDINTTELDALGTVWDARADYYDHAHNGQTTVKETLASALRAGFAELTLDGGRIRPVRDQARTVYEHMYTPQNMTGPLRRTFNAYDPDEFDGVDVTYTSALTWEPETVQCRLSGDAGTRVEKLELQGVTDRTRAWRIGMRARRAQAYRRRGYSFATELDALNSRYLSYCALSDDVPGYGQSALLVGLAGAVLTVSEPLAWVSGASHVAALRRPDGTLCGPFPATRLSDYSFSITGSIDFAPVTTAQAIEPTHVLFGTTTSWSYPALVTAIDPSGNTVDVTAINYDARVYADDDNTPA